MKRQPRKASAAANRRTTPVRLGRARGPQARDLRDAKDALYREHIMEVAERIFAEQGFNDTRMQDIAAAAGISLGRLYLSYSGKEQLHRYLLLERDHEMFNVAFGRQKNRAPGPGPVEHVLWLMEGHLQYLLQRPNYLRMLLKEGYVWYHQSAQPTAEEQQLWNRGIGAIEEVLKWGMNEGHFTTAKVGDQSRLLMTSQQARLANWVMDGMTEAHDAVIQRIHADFVRLFCPPAIIQSLLTPDGAALNTKTITTIRSLDLERMQASKVSQLTIQSTPMPTRPSIRSTKAATDGV